MSEQKSFPSLKAMAESKEIEGVQKTVYFQVDPRIIKVQEGFNARPIDQEHVAAIKQSYASGATLPPLYVRVDSNEVILVDGHHRHAALMELISEGFDVARIDCSQFRGNDADRNALMLTSAQGKALTPFEMGIQYKKLMGFGWATQEIANKVGKSFNHVSDMIFLANANSDVHSMVKSNEVSAAIAAKVVKQHGENAGKKLNAQLDFAKSQGKSKITAGTMKAAEPKKEATKGSIVALVIAEYSLSYTEAEEAIKRLFTEV